MAQDVTRYTVKVFLYEIEPLIWRRFTIAGTSTFAALHSALQKAMGWEDKEIHEFRYGKGKNLTDVIATPDPEIVVEGKFTDEGDLTLDDFMKHRRAPTRLLYRYDFIEDWVHEVVIESKADGKAGKPTLLEGERACPPEDCGGAWGYRNALEGEVEWMDDDYDPEKFDASAIKF